MGEFTHFDGNGNAVMVDVSEKETTSRTAVARGGIRVSAEIMAAVVGHTVQKGDVLAVARVAGILGVKQTAALIPMCHPLNITGCGIDFELDGQSNVITAVCTVKVDGRTGVEMEALTGVSVALLTIYDMCKAIDKQMKMTEIHLAEKNGGKSGEFHWSGT